MKKLIISLLMVVTLWLSVAENQLTSRQFEYEAETVKLPSSIDIENGLKLSDEINFEKCIDFIKEHEGYANGNQYYCVSGKLTIGYGHVIMEGESFPEHITLQQADSLLRSDLAKSRKMADGIYPNLKGSRKAAITHFIYSKGIGAFLRSNLKKQIDNNGNVDEEFAKWCFYTCKKTGKKVRSKMATKIQQWECDMWHADDELYALLEMR